MKLSRLLKSKSEKPKEQSKKSKKEFESLKSELLILKNKLEMELMSVSSDKSKRKFNSFIENEAREQFEEIRNEIIRRKKIGYHPGIMKSTLHHIQNLESRFNYP